jgi:hypothetical protein
MQMQLRQQSTYKNILAVIFLALYTFIATPVTLWHKHHNFSYTTATKEKAQATISKMEHASDGECSICSHEYTSYHYDVFTFINSIVSIPHKPLYTRHTMALVTKTFLSLSNKGPPRISIA